MDVSNFFTRLLQAPKESTRTKQVDDITAFDAAWTSIRVGQDGMHVGKWLSVYLGYSRASGREAVSSVSGAAVGCALKTY